MAYYKPDRFAQWVNDQRCSISISNDPSGVWSVQIGSLIKESRSSHLGSAMCHQFWTLEFNPNWTWTCDYLESV